MKETIIGVGIILVIVIVSIISIAQPHFEAKAFNDCTGGHATYFTALFTELRVQDCTK